MASRTILSAGEFTVRIPNPYAHMLYRLSDKSSKIRGWPECDDDFAPIVYPVHPFVVQIIPGMNLRIEPVSNPHPANPAQVFIEVEDRDEIICIKPVSTISDAAQLALRSGHLMARYMDGISRNRKWEIEDLRKQCGSLLKHVSCQIHEYWLQWIQQCDRAAREQEIPLLPKLQDFMRSLGLERRLHDVSVLSALLHHRVLEKHIPALEHDIRRFASAKYTQDPIGHWLAVRDMRDLLRCTSTLVAAELICKYASNTDIRFAVSLFYRSYRIQVIVSEQRAAIGGDILLTCNKPISWQEYLKARSMKQAYHYGCEDPLALFERRIEPLLEFVRRILYSEPVQLQFEYCSSGTPCMSFGYSEAHG